MSRDIFLHKQEIRYEKELGYGLQGFDAQK